MATYTDIAVIDAFEERYGNRSAVLLACHLMGAFLETTTKELPPILSDGIKSAAKRRNNLLPLSQLEFERKKVSAFIEEEISLNRRDAPACCVAYALEAVLIGYENPKWGGGASELVSNFLDIMENFDADHERFRKLLREIFS